MGGMGRRASARPRCRRLTASALSRSCLVGRHLLVPELRVTERTHLCDQAVAGLDEERVLAHVGLALRRGGAHGPDHRRAVVATERLDRVERRLAFLVEERALSAHELEDRVAARRWWDRVTDVEDDVTDGIVGEQPADAVTVLGEDRVDELLEQSLVRVWSHRLSLRTETPIRSSDAPRRCFTRPVGS